MSTKTKIIKQVCECKNCGNEAEMMVECRLEDEAETSTAPPKRDVVAQEEKRVKGTATCTHCGNEADMWVDL